MQFPSSTCVLACPQKEKRGQNFGQAENTSKFDHKAKRFGKNYFQDKGFNRYCHEKSTSLVRKICKSSELQNYYQTC